MNPVLMVNEKGQKALFVDGKLAGTWDKHDSDAHVWNQVAMKTDAEEVEERIIEGRLPETLSPSVDEKKKAPARKRKPKVEAEKKPVEEEEAKGPTTSYHTAVGVPEALSAVGTGHK